MINQTTEQPAVGLIIRTVLLLTLVIVLPGVQWSLFGWLHMVLPLAAFFILGRYGGFTGKRLILTAVALSLVVYLLQKDFELFLFAAGLLLAGYLLFLSAEKQDSPAMSWLKSSLGLSGYWIALITLFSMGSDLSPYAEFVRSIDEGIVEAIDFYRQSSEISSDTKVVLEATLLQMKVIIPLIFPSIIGSFIVVITWITMALGNKLLLRSSGRAPWIKCRNWQLPEKLIWSVIGAGILALLPVHFFRSIGINGLVLLSIVYCFQGLSIAIFFMNKWNVPVLLRSFFYVMMVFQSFGTLLLLIFGIADIWFDFRKLRQVPIQ